MISRLKVTFSYLALGVVALVCPESPFVGTAQADAAHVGGQKINLSGRQRMLSQRMAGASCLAMASIDVENRSEVVRVSHADFDRALKGLQFGDEGLGLPPETDEGILAAFAEVEMLWRTYSPAVQQLAEGDHQSVVIAQLMNLNLPVLKTSNEAVTRITETYGAGVVDPEMATTINVAGRQRMLSQKMMKEACFVAVGLNVEDNMQALTSTMSLFEASLQNLRNGSEESGIVAPPHSRVASQLQKVATLWEPYRTGLSLIEPDSADSRAALADLARQSDTVLKEMHKAVLLYVGD